METCEEADALVDVPAPNCAGALIGHGVVFELLCKQLSDNRLPSGVLLHGPKGIGKATLAFQLALKIFNETGDETPRRNEQQIHAGSHPNLYVLRRVMRERGAGFYAEIRVDEVRKVLKNLHQTRGRAGHRVLIVDAIDDCNRNAANALLKTLEEPPADTHIMLISHRPGRLLPTIRSRCQAHGMRGLSKDDMRTILQVSGVPKTELDAAIAISGGRPRRGFEALTLGNNQILQDLANWLAQPVAGQIGTHIKLAETLADKKNATIARFGREMILDSIAFTNVERANSSEKIAAQAASGMALWENANLLFEQTDTYNLDAKQSLIILFDQMLADAQAAR